jgi:hypothetical protein
MIAVATASSAVFGSDSASGWSRGKFESSAEGMAGITIVAAGEEAGCAESSANGASDGAWRQDESATRAMPIETQTRIEWAVPFIAAFFESNGIVSLPTYRYLNNPSPQFETRLPVLNLHTTRPRDLAFCFAQGPQISPWHQI